ncbi:RNA-directed DNA polymerase from mobile element jockey [Trichonephila clavipes]|nr:RNA-directed DNA polymerase from mobile element jockey [Trichonephila clavipes]
MAAIEDDVFFDALQKHCKIIESALMSKCNMNNQVREDARRAVGELKASSYKNLERATAANFQEACKRSLKEAIASQVTPKPSYANVVAPSAEIQEKSPELKASLPKRRSPVIIVKNVPNEVNKEDLLKVITEQNPEIVVDDESIRQCSVRFTLKTFKHTRHVVIETHPTLNESPGPDFISNEVIKQFPLAFPFFLHKLLNVYLDLGILPRVWKLAQVILIPKVNEFRVPHLDNLRCISLLLALGKCLEKPFVNRLCWYLCRGDFLSSVQYGFTPHKSTENALLLLNEIPKRDKKKHLHSILISLDIKGTFDNAWWPCILNVFKKVGIPINIFSLVADFLNDRVVKMQLGSTSAIRCLERVCPQRSVSVPIF